MNFSDTDIKYIDKYLKRLERDKRQWPWLRWVILTFSIIIIISAIYIYNQMVNITKVMESMGALHGNEFDPEMVELLVKGQSMKLKLELLILGKIVFYELLGGLLLVYCIKNWNRHIKSSILHTVLRKLSNDE